MFNISSKNKTKQSIRNNIDKKCQKLHIQKIINNNFINNQFKNKYSKNKEISYKQNINSVVPYIFCDTLGFHQLPKSKCNSPWVGKNQKQMRMSPSLPQ